MTAPALHFTAFLYPAGYHESAWRVVPDDPRAALGLPYYLELARIAEAGRLDALFLADNLAIAEYRTEYMPATLLDPVELLCALAGATEHIGLIATGSTTYSAPWELARRFATLDFLSAGRAGWNIVTTRSVLAAANFGLAEHPALADRYEQAAEFVEAVLALWDGWEDDAVVGDRETGRVGRARQAPRAGYPRPPPPASPASSPSRARPQGHPVLVQAGSSPAGVELAARHADLVFTRQPTVEARRRLPRPLRAQAAAAGREPDRVRVLPALAYTLGATEAAARPRQAELEELASPEFRWRNMLWMIGLDPDGPFDPDEPLPEPSSSTGRLPSSGAERVFAAARADRRAAARARAPPGRPARRADVRRHARAARRLHRGLVARRRGRRLHADGQHYCPTASPPSSSTVLPILRRARPVPDEYEGADAARAPRPAAAAEPPRGSRRCLAPAGAG